MSIEALRAEKAALRSTKLALWHVTAAITNDSLASLLTFQPDGGLTPPPESAVAAYLDGDDVASLPWPRIALKDDLSHADLLSSEDIDLPDHVTDASRPVHVDSIADSIEPSSSFGAANDASSRAVPSIDTSADAPITYSQKASEDVDGAVALPARIAPPLAEDEAELSGDTQLLLDLETPTKPAKVVHLPPEGVQEERRRREAEEERQRRSEDADQPRNLRSRLQTQHELASSPSSTVGAYSAATPMPQQDSPDTSPDSEKAQETDALTPEDMRPSPEEQREKEQHDRILAAQKEIARRQALGDVSAEDGQEEWAARSDAAREAEERAAREAVRGPEADAQDERDETMAEEIMEGVELDKAVDTIDPAASKPGTASGSPPSLRTETAPDDEDNITVTPRKHLLSIDTSKAQQQAVEPALAQHVGDDRMTRRTSSGALRKRSLSEMLGEPSSRRDTLSAEQTSPFAIRHPSDTAPNAYITNPFKILADPQQSSSYQGGLTNTQTALEELNALKGAAEDPERDYLEPLFRIQAHDSQTIRSHGLTDLIRTASKALSTEDQFTSIHERLDYRILRRIYHLQNANKWSLRQMDRAKEPEQPVTHHDYLMAEMQWMRKDFKAERKMKKSVCAWLARRCADWVAASTEERVKMQIVVQAPKQRDADEAEEQVPELELSNESPVEEDGPLTPHESKALPMNLIVPPELCEAVQALQEEGKLGKVLGEMPVAKLADLAIRPSQRPPLTSVSKFVSGKVLPKAHGPPRKRSRFDYEDEMDTPEDYVNAKRIREERDLPPEDEEIALFHPDNKVVRNRLHQNNAFRPPSEFVMPSTQFYEFRNGSQWLAEDDKKLRDLAKDYSFNWSLIADELQLPGIFKSSAERRTPWECFERWVELEQLPTEMKKTVYFKTWYQRLEQSQQAAERRYQAQVAALQAASGGQANHVPMRRRTVPSRVDKRKNTRYLWLVDAMRKLARKKEQKAYKEAENQRAASQRKTQPDNHVAGHKMLTPQEFSQKRHERDLQLQEQHRQHRQKAIELQQRQIQAARQAAQQAQMQQSGQNGMPNQQRPGSSSNLPAQQAQMQANGQPHGAMQMQQQGRAGLPGNQRNGHLAVPVNAQGVPQAQMRPNGQTQPTPETMQRLAQANAQARNQQYQPQFQMPGNMMSPGAGGLNAHQLQQSSQAMMASMQQQMNASQQNSLAMAAASASASPSMGPPPTPQNNPQQLSSGHVPALLNIKAQIRNKCPTYSEDQISHMATEVLKTQSQSSTQARQSAMNAAAGISNMQAYAHNQAAFQGLPMQGGNAPPGAGMSPASPQQYAQLMRARQMQQMQQSPNTAHASLNGSPGVAHVSPSMAPVSPNLQFSGMHQMGGVGVNGGQQQQQRPPSRSGTPQMQRLGSSGNLVGGVPSPQGGGGLQGSPRSVQASMAR